MLAVAGSVSIQASGVRTQGPGRFIVGRLADARLVNTGKGPIWRTVTASGVPAQPPAASASGLRLEKRFLALDGQSVDPSAIRQGDQFIVRLTVQTDDERSMQTVVDDALPAGLEIQAVLRPADAQGGYTGDDGKPVTSGRFAFLGQIDTPSMQEKRDDRYVAAFKTDGKHAFQLGYIVRAVTPGDFFLPGAAARNMYRPSVNAQTGGGRLKVAAGP
jgi:hypothetical protein